MAKSRFETRLESISGGSANTQKKGKFETRLEEIRGGNRKKVQSGNPFANILDNYNTNAEKYYNDLYSEYESLNPDNYDWTAGYGNGNTATANAAGIAIDSAKKGMLVAQQGIIRSYLDNNRSLIGGTNVDAMLNHFDEFNTITDSMEEENRKMRSVLSNYKSREEYDAALKASEDWYNAWGHYMDAEDFDQLSGYELEQRKKQSARAILMDDYSDEASGWTDPLREAINGSEEARGFLRTKASKSGGMMPNGENYIGAFVGELDEGKSEIKEMTEDEVKIFNYLYETEGKEKAHEFYYAIQGDLRSREMQKALMAARESAKKDWFGTSLATIALSPLKGLSYVSAAGDYLAGNGIDINKGSMRLSRVSTETRNAVATEIEKTGWGKFGSWGYQLGMSMGDSLMALGSGGGGAFTLAIMGTGAAADVTIAAKQKGLTDDQAFLLGTIAGAIEAATEKIGLDEFLDIALAGSSPVKYLLRNSLGEGTEELLSGVGNFIADTAIARDKSEWAAMMKKYKDQGMSDAKAFAMAVLETSGDIALDTLGGIVSGAGFGSMGLTTSMFDNASTGRDVINNGSVEGLRDMAGEYKQYAGKIDGRHIEGLSKKVSAETKTGEGFFGKIGAGVGNFVNQARVGGLYNAVAATVQQQNTADIQTALEAAGLKGGKLKTATKVLSSIANGEEISNSDLKFLGENEGAMSVFTDVILDKNSSVNKRNAQLAQQIEGGTVSAEQTAAHNQENAPTEESVYRENEVPAEATAEATEATVEPTKKVRSRANATVISNGKDESATILTPGHYETVDGKQQWVNGTVSNDSGFSEDVTTADFADPEQGAAWNAFANLGQTHTSTKALRNMDADTATELLALYDENENTSGTDFAEEILNAYFYGTIGASAKFGKFKSITKEQMQAAWELGNKLYNETASAVDTKTASDIAEAQKKLKESGKKVTGTGDVILEEDVYLEDFSKTEKATYDIAVRVSKAANVKIRIYRGATSEFGAYNRSTDEIRLNINAKQSAKSLMAFTLAHELVHRAKKGSPAQYRAFQKFLLDNYARQGSSLDAMIDQQIKAANEFDKTIDDPKKRINMTREMALEEVVCDACERMLLDSSVNKKLAQFAALSEENRTFVERVKEWIEQFMDRLRKLFKDVDPTNLAAAEFEKFDILVKNQLAEMFVDMTVTAGENLATLKAAASAVIEPGAKPIASGEILTDDAVVVDGEELKFSIKSMKADIADGKMFEDLKTHCGWTQEQVDELKGNLEKLVEYMTPFRDILDMNETYGKKGRRFSPYKPNSDPLYKISLDFSTLCSKRLLTQYVIEQLQLRENRPMSAEEQMAIRDMLNEYRKVARGLQVACAMCYVEAARLKSPKQINRWLADPKPHLINYFALKNAEFKAYVEGKQADFKESRGYARNTPKKDMKQSDVTALNKIGPKLRAEYKPSAEEQAIIDRAVQMPNSTYLTAANLANLSETDPVLYAAYTAFVRTATRSKSLETDEPYYYGDSTRDNGNGVVVTDSFIEAVNKENGMRFSSWSDWRIQHLLDYIVAVIDNSVRGAAMHGYTKFGDEVRVLGKTGMMFNMSGVAGTQTGLNEDGTLNFSDTESINVEEAKRLRDELPNTAGLQCIGVSDAHIIALLASDIIDYVIPYHVSGLNKGLRTMVSINGWKDYTSTQHATVDKSAKIEDAVDKEHWHEEPVFSEFFVGYNTGMTGIEAMRASAERYKQMCRDRGLKPKFEQFANEDNYWKLLIDRKMINQKTGNLIKQNPVTPTFDFAVIKDVVDRYVANYDANMESKALDYIVENFDSIPKRIRDLKKGGKKAKATSKAIDTVSNETLAAQPTDDIVRSIPKMDAAYMDAVNRGDMETAQRMVDEAADKKITLAMTDSERTEILQTKAITAEVYDGQADEAVSREKDYLESGQLGLIKSALTRIAEEFGVFTGYDIKDVEVKLEFSISNLHESVTKKITPTAVAKLMPVLKTAVENAVGIESHTNRYFYDTDIVRFDNLVGGYVDGENFVPVRFGLKHRINGEAILYVIIDQHKIPLNKIKAEVVKIAGTQSVQPEVSRSAFKVNISDLVQFVNSGDLLRYVPDDMLTESQKQIKWDAIADTIVKTNKKNDAKYAKYIREGKLRVAKQMVQAAAKDSGYTTVGYHGSRTPGFTVVDKYSWLWLARDKSVANEYGTNNTVDSKGKPHDENGVYAMRYNLGNNLEVYANGASWGELPVTVDEYPGVYADEETGYITTNAMAEWAERNGYDSITFVDVDDGGLTTVDVVFKPNRDVKSADPITYDDDGNVIPLSQRFNPENDDIRFKLPVEQDTSPRALLTQALESVATDDAELEKLRQYKANIETLNGLEARLQELRAEIKKLSFAKGKRDTARIAELRDEATKTANRIKIMDSKLLRLEATSVLQKVVDRERQNAAAKRKQMEAEYRRQNREQSKDQEILGREYLRLLNEYDKLGKISDKDMALFEKEYSRLLAEYEKEHGRRVSFETMIKELRQKQQELREDSNIYAKEYHLLMKEYEKQGKAGERDIALIEKEYSRLLNEYEKEHGRKVSSDAEIQRLKQKAKDNVEGRKKTEMRKKIRKKIRDLTKLFRGGKDSPNVKQEMRDAIATAIAAGEVLFIDNYTTDDMIRNGITGVTTEASQLLNEAKDILYQLDNPPAVINVEDISAWDKQERKYRDRLNQIKAQLKQVFADERARLDGTTVETLMDGLYKAYSALKNSDTEYIKAAFDPKTLETLATIREGFGTVSIKEMRLDQLEELYKAYAMVLGTVRNSNKLFGEMKKKSLAETISTLFLNTNRATPKTKLSVVARKISDSIGWDYEKLYYALERINNPVITELFTDLANSENRVMEAVEEAKQEMLRIVKKYGYNKWKVDERFDTVFVDNLGKEFQLTLGEVMSLYAYTRRDSAWNHLEVGGFVPATTKLTELEKIDPYKLTKKQCEAIIDKLTDSQKRFVEEMQRFLSANMGAKGNEVSMMLYGIELFGEENYFPIRIVTDFMARAQEAQAKEAAGFGSMSNAGFTHVQNKNSVSPVMMESFMNVWTDHVNEMSRYYGTVPALENIRKVMNYQYSYDGSANSVSTKVLLRNTYGKKAVEYLDDLYKEANTGAIRDKMQGLLKKAVSLTRKNSVAYSASTWIQQPASIVRAFAVLPRKYFTRLGATASVIRGGARALLDRKNYLQDYAEMRKYAPGVTIAKEIGGFDTAGGRSILGYLRDTGKNTAQKWQTGDAKGKVGAVMDLVDDNAIANIPESMDKIAWIEIWNACKREVHATHKTLSPKSDEFFETVGKRFTEVIRATQVYDSIFAKSPMLKSQNMAVQYVVSFMNEPNTTANMFESAIRDFAKGTKEGAINGTKKIHAVLGSTIFTALLSSIIYALRDDDEDETYIEKYLSSVTEKFLDDITVFNYIPYLRDVWSLTKGFDVSRPDTDVISSVISGVANVIKNRNVDTSEMTEWELEQFMKQVSEDNWKMAGAICSAFGIPLKNVYRDAKAILDYSGAPVKETTMQKIVDSLEEAVNNASPFFWKHDYDSNSKKLYNAIVNGDDEYIERLKPNYLDKYGEFSQEKFDSAVTSALKEHDPRIVEAAQAQIDGDPSRRVEIAEDIMADGFDKEVVRKAINSVINKMTPSEESTPKVYGFYDAEDFALEIANGDKDGAKAAKDGYIETKMLNGKTKDEAVDAFNSAAKSELKKLYISGGLTEKQVTDALERYCDEDVSDIHWNIKKWDYEKENGTTEGYTKYNDFYSAVQTGKNLKSVIKEYTSNDVKVETLASEITEYFKPIYKSMSKSQRASLKGYLLNAYEQLGYDREKRSAAIDKWLED